MVSRAFFGLFVFFCACSSTRALPPKSVICDLPVHSRPKMGIISLDFAGNEGQFRLVVGH